MGLFVDIEKRLGAFRLRVRFEAEEGVTALLGASGCGKSMTLKCIAGIEKPDRGKIILDGVTLFDSEKHLSVKPQERRVGYLFQQYALFPTMTVEENVRCGVRERKDRRERAAEMIERMGLHGLEKRTPRQLSGGQQQRVALARILVNDPELLLLDEPFSALDSHLRSRMEGELRQLLREFRKPVLMVSHDREEVYRLSQRVIVLHDGSVETQGTREEVYRAPGTPAGALLTGCRNVSPVELREDGLLYARDWGIPLRLEGGHHDVGAVGIPMEALRPGPGENETRCRVLEVLENPCSLVLFLRPLTAPEDSTPLVMELPKGEWAAIAAEELTVSLPDAAILRLKGEA